MAVPLVGIGGELSGCVTGYCTVVVTIVFCCIPKSEVVTDFVMIMHEVELSLSLT